MCLIAVQPYIKIEREVSSTQQINVEHKRNIYLYTDKVVTKHREFPIDEVIDVSYRKSGEVGLLYIHTSSGLFSYTVRTSTDQFIEAFNKRKKKRG